MAQGGMGTGQDEESITWSGMGRGRDGIGSDGMAQVGMGAGQGQDQMRWDGTGWDEMGQA